MENKDKVGKISIIIPIYNVEKYINHQCLESISMQTYGSMEILLIDDGSTDQSGNLCDEYAKIDKRFQVIHKANGGVSSARQVGLNKATGDYISFIDPDDYIEPNMMEEMLEKFILMKGKVDVVTCEYYHDSTPNEMIYNDDQDLLKGSLRIEL